MEWNIVFYVSTVIALIPVLVFSVWGSAEVQSWARSPSIVSTSMSCPTMSTTASSASLAPKENASEQNCVMQGQRKNSEIATNKEIERYDEREIYWISLNINRYNFAACNFVFELFFYKFDYDLKSFDL